MIVCSSPISSVVVSALRDKTISIQEVYYLLNPEVSTQTKDWIVDKSRELPEEIEPGIVKPWIKRQNNQFILARLSNLESVIANKTFTVSTAQTKTILSYWGERLYRLYSYETITKDGLWTYKDGYKVYTLHGILIPMKYYPAGKLKPADILSEPDVDIRRELIRAFGLDRMLGTLHHMVIDKQGNYELLKINLPITRNRFWNGEENAKQEKEVVVGYYLKMTNPSVGCFHLEGVPRVKTVKEALEWRNNQWFEHAEILT